MYVSTKVGKRTSVTVRHGGFALLAVALACVALAPWFAIIGGVVGFVWVVGQHPSTVGYWVGVTVMFAPVVGGWALLVTWFTASGVVVWLVPVVVTVLASSLFVVTHPHVAKVESK